METAPSTSTSAPSTSTSAPSSVIYYSIYELINIIYIGGLNSVTGWEIMLENLKKIVFNETDTIINLFFILFNAVTNFYSDEVSQATYIQMKDAKLSFEELITCFQEQIEKEYLYKKTMSFDLIKRFRELVENSKIEVLVVPSVPKLQDPEIINIESEHDDDDDDDDDIKRAFSTVFSSKKSKQHNKFEQSFHLLVNDEKQWIKTPGEEGRYLVEIKITDTKDIKKVPTDEWWKKVHKKAVFLASSSQDTLYIDTNKILKNAFDRINKIKNKSQGKYSVDSRFKPY